MVKRIAAIVFIWFCTAAAWALLGSTILYRTYETGAALKGRVASTWGTPHSQLPPSASYGKIVQQRETLVEAGKKQERIVDQRVETPLPLDSSRILVDLDLEHRQKGLLWYSTYKVAFSGAYRFRNSSDAAQDVQFSLKFPAERAIYDDLVFELDGRPLAVTNSDSSAQATAQLGPGQTGVLKVGYHSQGLDNWTYSFGPEISQVRDFQLKMTTNFRDIDFPDDTLSPSEKREASGGMELAWNYSNLLTGIRIGMVLPGKLQPGPLAGQISFFAPVSLFFFFFLMFIITTMRNIELHPMNYFFLAAAFFAFHLLLAYLVDHISIHVAFGVCSAVSIFLVVSYLRLVVGMRFAALEAGISQFIYLVLFSYAFFFKGFTGLSVTIGAILTLFVVMQLTGRVRWSEKFAPTAG